MPAKNSTEWKSWALGISVTLIFFLVGALVAADSYRLESIETTTTNTLERVNKLEAQYDSIDQRLVRIEGKIDKIQPLMVTT